MDILLRIFLLFRSWLHKNIDFCINLFFRFLNFIQYILCQNIFVNFKIYNSITELPNKLAIFPLTGAVLFPQTQLPLNIFEPRYLNMIDEVLSSPDRIMGMIQPNISKNDPNSKNLKRFNTYFVLNLFLIMKLL